mmetsp:Transcript_77497/g.195680  ORF Transcript_77497/g.195680 Transcript_77497/m.195680 type:complete len:211 (-) Transcript_77497:331-963(-)
MRLPFYLWLGEENARPIKADALRRMKKPERDLGSGTSSVMRVAPSRHHSSSASRTASPSALASVLLSSPSLSLSLPSSLVPGSVLIVDLLSLKTGMGSEMTKVTSGCVAGFVSSSMGMLKLKPLVMPSSRRKLPSSAPATRDTPARGAHPQKEPIARSASDAVCVAPLYAMRSGRLRHRRRDGGTARGPPMAADCAAMTACRSVSSMADN